MMNVLYPQFVIFLFKRVGTYWKIEKMSYEFQLQSKLESFMRCLKNQIQATMCTQNIKKSFFCLNRKLSLMELWLKSFV